MGIPWKDSWMSFNRLNECSPCLDSVHSGVGYVHKGYAFKSFSAKAGLNEYFTCEVTGRNWTWDLLSSDVSGTQSCYTYQYACKLTVLLWTCKTIISLRFWKFPRMLSFIFKLLAFLVNPQGLAATSNDREHQNRWFYTVHLSHLAKREGPSYKLNAFRVTVLLWTFTTNI